MAVQRTDFIVSASRALTDHATRSGLSLRTPIHEGLEKFRRRFTSAFDEIEQRPDGESIYQSILPLSDRNSKITTV